MYVRCNYVSLGPDKPGQSTVTTAAPRDGDVTTAAPLTRILLQLCWTTAASARASASSASTTRRSSRPLSPACRACPAWVASPWRSILVKRCWVWKFHKADPNPKMFWLPLSPVILSLVKPRDHDFLLIFFQFQGCMDLSWPDPWERKFPYACLLLPKVLRSQKQPQQTTNQNIN